MRWKISIEGSDEITQGHRLEFEIAKSLDDLAAGSLGLSIDDGKTILASLQRFLVEQQCALGSGQNMGVMRGVFCLRRSADHRELRPL